MNKYNITEVNDYSLPEEVKFTTSMKLQNEPIQLIDEKQLNILIENKSTVTGLYMSYESIPDATGKSVTAWLVVDNRNRLKISSYKNMNKAILKYNKLRLEK